MRKLLITIIAMLFILPIMVKSEDKNLVKVYIFEAGGCPYCEAQIKYLKGLDSYNKKFKIIRKETFVDHIDWEPGKDFDLAKKVSEAFEKVGFEDATYQATPFVVISDKYAQAGYSESLENIINEAYEEGDNDIVKCYQDGKTNCLDHLAINKTTTSKGNKDVIITIIISTVLIIATYLVKSTLDTKKIIEAKSKKSLLKK